MEIWKFSMEKVGKKYEFFTDQNGGNPAKVKMFA